MTAVRAFVIAALFAAVLTLVAIVWWDSTRAVTVVVKGNPDATVVVQVMGAVASPGVVSLPAGSRLEQAISAAGGLTSDADITQLYLAARVGDGERISVPRKARIASSSPAAGVERAPASNGPGEPVTSKTVTVTSLVNINTATSAQLVALPGIGEVLANRIIAYRDSHGPFSSINQLDDVDGISANLVEKLRPLVTVGD
ncbi:MAG: helix-hairpin-helix domain-containing protein [Thermomicrobiales bacterium]